MDGERLPARSPSLSILCASVPLWFSSRGVIFATAVILLLLAAPVSQGASAPLTMAQADAEPVRISMAEAFFIQRDPRTGGVAWIGSLIIWFLLLLSIASLGLIGAMASLNRRERILPQKLSSDVGKMLSRQDEHGALLRVKRDESYFALIMRAALLESAHGHDAMVRALERSSEEHTTARLRRVETLNIIGAVSPMIGLFGTVYGMILAFQEIVAAGGSPEPVGLAAGIGTALTTTFWGLVVAIPALAGYAFVRNMIDGLTAEASLVAEDLVNHFRPSPGIATEAQRHGEGEGMS